MKVYSYTVFLTVCSVACSGAMAKAYGTVSVIQGRPKYIYCSNFFYNFISTHRVGKNVMFTFIQEIMMLFRTGFKTI